jgi:endoglucanase
MVFSSSRQFSCLAVALSAMMPIFAMNATTDIKVDQAGYLSNSEKLAVVVKEGAERFSLRRTKDNSVAFAGTLRTPMADEHSGDSVRIADFSSVRESGSYYLDVPGVGRSWDFAVAPDVFDRVYYLAMRGFYAQRCGTAVNMGPEFPQYRHDICHTDGAYDPSSGNSGPHSSAKGWHDAGDYGRYIVNSGISTATLLWAWELYRDRIEHIRLNIPESGNGTPDVLNEVRWNLDWMLSMQDADGGVFHKQTSTHFCGFVMPEQDKLPSVVIGTGEQPFKSSCATADLAAVAAIAGRLYKPYDAAYAAKCLRAAENAWQWIEAHPNVTFQNPPGITTGDYGDKDCSDEHLWAAVELWRTTGNAAYERYFLSHYREFLPHLSANDPQSWSQVAPLALWGYVLGQGSNADAENTIRQAAVRAADQISSRASADPYRISLTTKDFIWGSNGLAANYSMQLLVADIFSPNPKYVTAAADNLHYILGRNTFSLSWVTHVGQHAFQQPHHRPSAADTVAEPWPGLMSGGPNPGRQDNVMKQYVPADAKPMRAYVDMTGAYACNEVAINWNAPLVFALAALASK